MNCFWHRQSNAWFVPIHQPIASELKTNYGGKDGQVSSRYSLGYCQDNYEDQKDSTLEVVTQLEIQLTVSKF